MLLPEIKEMVATGKTQREIVEHFGFKDKYVVKGLLKRERRKEAKIDYQRIQLKTGVVPLALRHPA